MHTLRRFGLVLLALLVFLPAAGKAGPLSGPAALPPGVVQVGLGSYATQFPVAGGNKQPANRTPYVTAALSGRPIPTSDWWTSLVFKQNPANPSENLFIDPMAARVVTSATGIAARSGLQINQPRTPSFADVAGPPAQPAGQFQYLIGTANAPVDLSLGMMAGALVSGYGPGLPIVIRGAAPGW
jgi:hypothetical protein